MDDQQPHDQLALERILFFSDAVFAIAITLLVIEIRVPEVERDAGTRGMALELIRLAPQFVGFIITFFLIGQTWVEHHRIGRLLRTFDRGLIWRNLGLLFFVVTMPFATALLSEYFTMPLAIVFYAAVLAALGLCKAWMWSHVVRVGLVDGASEEAGHIGRRVWATPITAALVGVVGALGVPGAMVGFALIPAVAQWLDRPSRVTAGERA